VDEDRKRVGIIAAILVSMHMPTADDLFGGPQGSPFARSILGCTRFPERLGFGMPD